MGSCAENQRLKHGCIVMASGMGTRFGANKLMAVLEGKPLIQHVAETVRGLFDELVVVTRSDEVARLCRSLDVAVILHSEPHRNDTVRLGMEAIAAVCDTVTFMQGDQPLISARSIQELLADADDDPSSIWRVAFEGTPGAPVLFPAWTFDELCALPQSKGGGYVAKAHRERVRTVEVTSSWELFDVDTQEDLLVLEEHVSAVDLGSMFV